MARTGVCCEALAAELCNHLIRAPAFIRSSNNSSVSLIFIPLGKSYTSRIWLTPARQGNDKETWYQYFITEAFFLCFDCVVNYRKAKARRTSKDERQKRIKGIEQFCGFKLPSSLLTAFLLPPPGRGVCLLAGSSEDNGHYF